MAFLFNKFQEAIKTLARNPRFARDPRHLLLDADMNHLFLYTSYFRLEENSEENDAEEIVDMASKVSVTVQQNKCKKMFIINLSIYAKQWITFFVLIQKRIHHGLLQMFIIILVEVASVWPLAQELHLQTSQVICSFQVHCIGTFEVLDLYHPRKSTKWRCPRTIWRAPLGAPNKPSA